MGRCSVYSMLLFLMPVIAKVSYIEDDYIIDNKLGAFSHLVMNKNNGRLYVGAMNRLYEFDQNLNKVQEVTTGPKPDNPFCPERTKAYECDLPNTNRDSFNKALVIDYNHNQLIACISLFQGICEKYSLDNIQEKEPTNYQPVVANNATATSVLFIAPGPATDKSEKAANVLYAGVQRTNTGKSDIRDRVPAFASRRLDNFHLVYNDGFSSKTQVKFEAQHRDSFPVYYIYGFSSGTFSYMITVQKKSTTSESYITKIFRVCHNDLGFRSYAEVRLQCWHNGALYNLSQAAFLGKAGVRLAKTLGIPDTEDVLYVVFSIGHPNSVEPGRDSALCLYPMRDIRKQFTKNIKDCFQGVGNLGPQHIVTPYSCTSTPNLVVDDNYCGKHETNYPIDGSEPIKADAAATFNTTVSAVTISVVSDYTVAFVGTTNGHIIKVALTTKSTGKVYEDVAVAEGNKIMQDMLVDTEGNHLFAMTDRKLLGRERQNGEVLCVFHAPVFDASDRQSLLH